ncbi:indolepyruvate ferredoxin oxidoreductase subunit alpha [Providencia huaxiensis]
MLNKQRREKKKVRTDVAAGKRVVRERFGIDPDTCTGDHSCIRLSGCPSLSIKPNQDPLRTDPVATVMDSCVGCGLCGEVSHAAVLCPSFLKPRLSLIQLAGTSYATVFVVGLLVIYNVVIRVVVNNSVFKGE